LDVAALTEDIVAPVSRLVNKSLDFDAVTPWSVARCTFLDPNFSPDLSLVALEGGRPVGFALGGMRTRAPEEMVSSEHGWVKLLAVHPEWAGRGLEEYLLKTLEERMRGKGALDVRVSDFAGWQFSSGVDTRYEGLLSLYMGHGYSRVSEALEYEVGLLGIRPPPHLQEMEVMLAREGYSFSLVGQGEKEDVVGWAHERFGPLQAHECSEAFRHAVPFLWLALKGGERIGYAAYGALELHWLGPIGVVEVERRREVREALLYRALLSMREEGLREAVIPSSPEDPVVAGVTSLKSVRRLWILYKKF